MKKRKVFCDIEANGLDPDTIWCIVCKDKDTGDRFIFRNPQEVKENFPSFAATVETWIGHNFTGYDMWVINKLVPNVTIKVANVWDTLVLARMNRPTSNSLSLDDLGEEVGIPKVKNEVWTEWSENIVTRCIGDVDITEGVFKLMVSEDPGHSWESIRLEHNVAYICEEQRRNGFTLDVPKVQVLLEVLHKRHEEVTQKIAEEFPPTPKFVKLVIPSYKKNGEPTARYIKDLPQDIVGCPYVEIEMVPFNPGSPPQVVARMNEYGWKPYEFTKNGTPKVTEANLATLPETAPEAAKHLAEWKLLDSRLKLLEGSSRGAKGWLDLIDLNNKVHGSCVHIGTITHRMAHRNPNMGNIPSVDAPYGDVCREVWCVSDAEKFNLLGVDASGIQLRMLAHYINDPAFTDVVLNGDIHCYMAAIYTGKTYEEVLTEYKKEKAAKVVGPYTELRSKGKTLTYAICFGAGAGRAASIFGITKREGQEMIDRLGAQIQGLKRVRDDDAAIYDKGDGGWYRGIDGRMLWIKKAHYYLPALLQGGEVAVMKLALVRWYNEAKKRNINFSLCNNIHDEWQTEVEIERTEELAQIQIQSIREAGEFLKLNCPMDGDRRIGKNWKETH